MLTHELLLCNMFATQLLKQQMSQVIATLYKKCQFAGS